MTDIAVCHVPAQLPSAQDPNNEPDPTAASWRAAAAINVRHVRMDRKRREPQWWEPALRAVRDGAPKIGVIANFGELEFGRDGGTFDPALAPVIEADAFDFVRHYGPELEALSWENEYGLKTGMQPGASPPDISQGGAYDWIENVAGPLWLAFARGVRRANPDIWIDAFDADSTDVQQRCMAFVLRSEFAKDPRLRWMGHNYADVDWFVHLAVNAAHVAAGEPEEPFTGQDYSSMAGMPATGDPSIQKPGFLSVFDSDSLHRQWYISETGKSTGPFGGIATPSDMQVMIGYTKMMLSKYPQCRMITFGTAKHFFTRVPVQPWRNPVPMFSTWTTGEPVVSQEGAELAGLFDPPVTSQPIRRRASK
jgi:hypothetical protein